MFPGLAIDYTRSMKVNTAVELLQFRKHFSSALQCTAQSLLCFFSRKLAFAEQLNWCLSAMHSSVILLLLFLKTGLCRWAKLLPATNWVLFLKECCYPGLRHPFSKARLQHSQTVIQPWMFMEKPSQFSVGQTAQRLTCSIMDKPHTGLDDCLRMLQKKDVCLSRKSIRPHSHKKGWVTKAKSSKWHSLFMTQFRGDYGAIWRPSDMPKIRVSLKIRKMRVGANQNENLKPMSISRSPTHSAKLC